MRLRNLVPILCAIAILGTASPARGQLECADWFFRGSGELTGWSFGPIAYDTARGRLLVAGRSKTSDWPIEYDLRTATWDGGEWSVIATDGPGRAWGASMAFDEARGVAVLIRETLGDDGTLPPGAETWEFDGTSWRLCTPLSGLARPFRAVTLVYDSVRRRIVRYGAAHNDGSFDARLWAWDGLDWIPDAVPGPTPASHSAYNFAMGFDRGRNVMVIAYGGASAPTTVDFWEHNGTSCVLRTAMPGMHWWQWANFNVGYERGSGALLFPLNTYGGCIVYRDGQTSTRELRSVCHSNADFPNVVATFADPVSGVLLAVEQSESSYLMGVGTIGPPTPHIDTLSDILIDEQITQPIRFQFHTCGAVQFPVWYRNGVRLTEQNGAERDELFLEPAYASTIGDFWAESTNACGTLRSNVAHIRRRCPLDFDRDGAVDFFDYDAFVSNYYDNEPFRVDFNGDGHLDELDLIAFTEAFERGCD